MIVNLEKSSIIQDIISSIRIRINIALEYFNIILTVFMLLLFFAPFFLLWYQFFFYLKKGIWISFSVLEVLSYFDFSWIKQPNDWLGIWKFLNKLPLFFGLSFISVITWPITSKRLENL